MSSFVFRTKDSTIFSIPIQLPESSMIIVAAFINCLQPRPARIAQGEAQFVELIGMHHDYYSLYPTETQSTAIKLYSSINVTFADRPPAALHAQMLTFGPYLHTEPLSVRRIYL